MVNSWEHGNSLGCRIQNQLKDDLRISDDGNPRAKHYDYQHDCKTSTCKEKRDVGTRSSIWFDTAASNSPSDVSATGIK